MMFMEHGISGIRLSTLLITIQVAKMLFDIPAGIIGDIYSRRNLLIFGQLARIAYCTLWLFFHSYTMFFIGAILYGLGMSCIYYHTEAYFYDALDRIEHKGLFSQTIGRYYAVQNIAITIATWLSGYLFSYFRYEGVFVATIVMLLISILVALRLPDHRKTKREDSQSLKALHIFKLIGSIVKKPKLVRNLFFSATLDALFIILIDLNTVVMSSDGVLGESVSHVIAVMGFIRIFTNYFSGYSVKHMTFKRMNTYLMFIMIGIMLFSCSQGYFITGAIVGYLCIYPFFDNSIKTKIQTQIVPETRATVMSFASLLASSIAVMLNYASGTIAESIGYRASVFMIGAVVIIGILLLRQVTKLYKISNFVTKILPR